MSLGDGFLVAFAVIDLLCVIALALAGLQLAKEGKATVARIQPSVAHLKRTADSARHLALSARERGMAAWREMRQLGERLRGRVETTRHIVRQLKPPRDEGADSQALVRDAQAALAQGQDWAGRLSRLRRAAASASSKAPGPASGRS